MKVMATCNSLLDEREAGEDFKILCVGISSAFGGLNSLKAKSKEEQGRQAGNALSFDCHQLLCEYPVH